MSRPFSDRIEGNSLKILAAIMDSRGKQPTIRELAKVAGCQINNVAQHLDRLKRLGLITWEPGKARTLMPAVRFIPSRDLP